ncbi:DUF3993 domain-containing protein, partial [Bacillus sp. HC-TM]
MITSLSSYSSANASHELKTGFHSLFVCVAFLVGYSVTTVLGKEEVEVDRKEVFTTIQKGYETQF